MKKKKIISTLIQVGLLVVCAGGFLAVSKSQVAPKEAYVFTRNISANTVITEGDLKKVVVPADGIQKNFVTDKSEIVGKAIASNAYEGQYVISNQLTEEEDIDVFEQIDLSNYRKITISVDMSKSIGGNIKKGDSVDLQYTGKTSGTDGSDATYAKTFMQDVLVYNVIDDGGYQYVDKSEGNTSQLDSDGNEVQSGNICVVTLCVTSEQADEIQARLNSGAISLVGRFDESVNSSSNGYTIGGYTSIQTSNSTPEN